MLTLAAATATVVAVGSIFLVPAIDACAGREDGLVECLREQAAAIAGRDLPPVASDVADTDPTNAEPAVPPPAGRPQAGAGPVIRPEVDTLSVTRDGEVMIAGRGEPGADVSVFANGELFGTVTAEPDGDWAMLPDTPLPPGGTAITAGDAEGDVLAEKAFVVVIDPEREVDPKVIPSAPGDTAALLLDVAPPLTELPPSEQVSQPPGGGVSPTPEPGSTIGLATAPPSVVPDPSKPIAATGELPPPKSPLVPVGERAAREVAAALAKERDVTPVAALPEPQPVIPPTVLPVGERAAREVAVALANQREVTPLASTPSPPVPAVLPVGERAAREVAVALANQREVTPLASTPSPPAPPVLPVGERAAREVAVALANQREVIPVLSTPSPPAPPVLPVGERAAREVAVALANQREVIPVLSAPSPPAPTVLPVGERAARDVALALARERAVGPGSAVSAQEEALGPVVRPVGERAAREVAVALANQREIVSSTVDPEALPQMGEQPLVEQVAPGTPDAAAVERGRREARQAVANPVETPAVPAAAPDRPRLSDGDADFAPAPAGVDPAPVTSPAEPTDVAAIVRGWLEAAAAVDAATGATTETATSEGAPQVVEPEPREVPPPVEVAIRPTLPAMPEVRGEDEPAPVSATAAPPPTPDEAPAPEPVAAPAVRAILVSDAELSRLRPGRFVVRAGDTLWDIAERVYGDGSKYQTIFRANRHVIARPGVLRPGQVIEIPLVYD